MSSTMTNRDFCLASLQVAYDKFRAQVAGLPGEAEQVAKMDELIAKTVARPDEFFDRMVAVAGPSAVHGTATLGRVVLQHSHKMG